MSDDDDDELDFDTRAFAHGYDDSEDQVGGNGLFDPRATSAPVGPQMPIPALHPVGMRPLDASGNGLGGPGRPNRPAPDFSDLPFKTTEELHQFLDHNESSALTAAGLLKGAVRLLHHHLVGVPVTELSFEKLLRMFYIDYRYADTDTGGHLEVANCNQMRDLEAVRANLFVYGGHLVNTIEVLIIESRDVALAMNRTSLRYIDPDLNLWFCELYTRLELYNNIVPNMYRAALPNAASIDALEEQRSNYSQGLQMYHYMEGEPPNQVWLGFYTMFMVVKLKLRLFNGRLYQQVSQSKYEIEMTADGENYVCAHRSPQCPTCRVGLNGHRKNVVAHVFEPKVKKVRGRTVNTRSWKPFITNGKQSVQGFKLRVKDGTVKEFITAICSSAVNRRAAALIFEYPKLVYSVSEFILMAKEPMLPPLEPYTRAWSFYNGILIDTVFYAYDDLPPKYENLSTVRLYNTWHFDEQIRVRLQGKPTGGTRASGDVAPVLRTPAHQFEGYVQNLFCTACHKSKYTANHDNCAADDEADHGSSSSSSSGGGGGGGGLAWELHCANPGCYQTQAGCRCESSVYYIQNPRQFLEIETTFFDRTIVPQIKASVMASPMGRRFLGMDEQQEVYITILAMLGRTFHKIGDNAVRENKERVAKGEAPVPTDNLNACLGMIGKAGTGKSTISKILENSLKEFGVLDNHASREFWGAQLLNGDLEFKPIISSEIGSDFWPRDRFCKAVANEPLVVKRKNINDDVVALCEYQLTLFGNKWELEEVEGSVARRVLMFMFTKRLNPDDIDSQLFARIIMDMGSWIVKALLAYRYFVEKMSNNGMWSAHGVPAYFHYTKDLIELRNNVHLSFLREGFGPSGEFLFHSRAYISEGAYIEAAKAFAARKGMEFPEWTPEVYESQFEDFGLSYAEKGRMTDNHGEPLTDDRYIRGIGYAQEFPDLLREANQQAEAAKIRRSAGRRGQSTVPPGQESPEIQNLRNIMAAISQNGLVVPTDLIEKMRALF